MSTMEERLDRPEWEPSQGETLLGTIAAVLLGELTTRDGETMRYPILVVKRDDGLGEVEVRCSRGGLLAPVVAYGVANGDPTGQRIGIRYLGTVPTGGNHEAHRYKVAFEKETAQPVDWGALAAARQTQAATPPAGSSESAWAAVEATAATTETTDEPPF